MIFLQTFVSGSKEPLYNNFDFIRDMSRDPNQNQQFVTVLVSVLIAMVFAVIYIVGNKEKSLLREEEQTNILDINLQEMKREGKKVMNDPEFRKKVKEEIAKPENRELIEEMKKIRKSLKEQK